MADFTTAFRVQSMRSGNPAVYLLKEQFESFVGSSHRVDSCDWIARCFYQLEQYGEAGSWYEAAGSLLYSTQGLRPELRALTALEEYERALECYERAGDENSMDDCSAVVERLRRACAPA
ncbi:MAG: hypothetical protein LYZ66_00825 [Nitrososphaerales archaeon]|nr:hypothetical protein [Nitrososphaerales archaeon]